MKRVLMAAMLLTILCSATGWAFDGERKGFVIGGGLGFGPSATVKLSDFDEHDSYSGLGINFLIGYAWDNENMILFLRDGVLYSLDVFSDNVSVVQGFTGLAWAHYFGEMDRGGYINVGLGLQDWTSLEDKYESNDAGFGMLFGGGYEFTRHVQIYGNFSFGKTDYHGIDFSHTQLTIGVAAIAF